MRWHPLFPAACVVLGAAVWGLYWLAQRGVAGAGPGSGWAVTLVNLPPLALAAIVAALTGQLGKILIPKVFLAGAAFGAGFAFYAVALVETSVVRATILFYLTPVWGTLLGIAVLGERAGPRRWLAIALALPGLVLILGAGSLGGSFGRGEVLGLMSGFVWALGAVTVRHGQGLPVAALGLAQYATTVTLGVVIAVLFGQPAPPPGTALGALNAAVVAYAMTVLAAFYVIYWAMARMSAGRSGLLMMSEVVVAVISAAILLPDEALGPLEWLGAGLILAAAVIEIGADAERVLS